MNGDPNTVAIPLLRWTVGVIVGIESALFTFSSSAAHHLTLMGLPAWIGPALGSVEILAALVFLVPAATRVGGFALLAIFAVAIVLHLLHGQYNVGPLAVCAAAVWAVLAANRTPATGVPA